MHGSWYPMADNGRYPMADEGWYIYGRRLTLIESELVSPRLRLISQAALDAYRAHHLGQVGQPSRKRQRMRNKVAEAQARKTAAGDKASEAPMGTEETDE